MSRKTREEVVPAAFINGALTYQAAGDVLCNVLYDQTKNHHGLDPLYTLYFHAVELALKGLLRAHGRTTGDLFDMKHDLPKLYAECEKRLTGLDATARRSIRDVISLLDHGNKDQGFRYYSPKGRGMPELSWTREVVQIVVQAARAVVLARDPDAEKPTVAMKIDFVVGKPELK